MTKVLVFIKAATVGPSSSLMLQAPTEKYFGHIAYQLSVSINNTLVVVEAPVYSISTQRSFRPGDCFFLSGLAARRIREAQTGAMESRSRDCPHGWRDVGVSENQGPSHKKDSNSTRAQPIIPV